MSTQAYAAFWRAGRGHRWQRVTIEPTPALCSLRLFQSGLFTVGECLILASDCRPRHVRKPWLLVDGDLALPLDVCNCEGEGVASA